LCDGQPLSRCRQGCRALDFGSLIAKARHILAVHAPARAELAARFSHVMVDEFQVPEGANSSAGRMRTNSPRLAVYEQTVAMMVQDKTW
jgi:hypothetical protein